MTYSDSSYSAWLLQPYLDLGPCQEGPLHVHRIELDYRELSSKDRGAHGLQRILPPSFRESLISETGLWQYNVSDPLQLKSELRTPRWTFLCHMLEQYSALPSDEQLRVVNLLNSLCFYDSVVARVPTYSEKDIADSEICAKLAFARASARFVLHLDRNTPFDREEFAIIAHNAPTASLTRANAALNMIVQSARHDKDHQATIYWSKVAYDIIQVIELSTETFSYQLLMSRYYRAASLAPQLAGNREELTRQLDLAERFTRDLPRTSLIQAKIADATMHSLLETRTKEALWLGDLDLAEEHARDLVQLDPLDAKARIELGEVLLMKGKLNDAISAYRAATYLGPPGTAIAWFMLGQCYEDLHELHLASDAYLSALKIDPEGISSLERLVEISTLLGNAKLAEWSRIRLHQNDSQVE